MECPILKKEGGCCSLSLAKLATPVNTAIVFVLFNLSAFLIEAYEVGIISLIAYSCLLTSLFLVVHVQLSRFIGGKKESLEAQVDESNEEKNDEEAYKQAFVWVYTKGNEAIQFLRKVILVKSTLLTAKFLLVLFLASQIAHALGDFCFFVFIGNDLILIPLVYANFGEEIKSQWEHGKKIVKEKAQVVLEKVPKYSDLKKN